MDDKKNRGERSNGIEKIYNQYINKRSDIMKKT